MNLFLEIRTSLHWSQAKLAEEIGVVFATVNRWENGKTIPNRLAQEKLLSICETHNIDLTAIIEKHIRKEAEEVRLRTPSRQVLYHSSKSGIQGPITPSSRMRCDFGSGFYMGTEPLQPLTLICDYENSIFYILSIDLTALKCLSVPADLEWALLIACHRGKMDEIKGTHLFQKYDDMDKGIDLIIGSIANDWMFYVLDNFFQGNITDIALTKSLSALKLGQQYVAVTQKACDSIRIEKEHSLLWIERQALKKASEGKRIQGISLANKICKDYRRQGQYFDEILEKAGDVSWTPYN